MDFFTTDVGLVNLNYSSTPAPRNFPILCPSAIACGNTIAGHAVPDDLGHALAGPGRAAGQGHDVDLHRAARSNDVVAANRYIGHERVTIAGVPGRRSTRPRSSRWSRRRARWATRSESGVRTVWWVYGVGPVQIAFEHTGGETSSSQLARPR